MFNKIFIAAVLLLLSQLSLAGKIVVFDHEEAIFKTKLFQDKVAELNAKPGYAQVKAQAESLKADLAALSKEASVKSMTWSAEEGAEYTKKVEYIQADYKLAVQKLQSEQATLMKGVSQLVQPKLEAALDATVKAEGIDMVLRKQAGYFSVPSVDITDKIVQAIDKTK
ncbi:MAG: outer membrane protein [Lentisphaeria bacterium]|jgi:outer membrane protein